MKILFELLILLTVLLVSVCEGSLSKDVQSRRNHRIRTPSWSTCPIPKIKNGTFRLQRAGRMGYFYCDYGFEINGPMSILCISGRWKQDIPICIKSGCAQPPERTNGLVFLDEKKQKSMLFCHDEFVAAGNSISFCNGTSWDRQLGECRLDVGHSKVCDFETISICGWTQYEENDFKWVRKSGWTSFEKLEYGPKHDHTKGVPLEGHYMIAEATNSRITQRSRIVSPIHNKIDSESACFRFFYHMYGQKVGRLRVIIKTVDDSMDEVVDNARNILFEKENSQGNQWNEGFFEIESVKTDFQIVIEATGSRGLISDIAIDDVALLKNGDCMNHSKPETSTAEDDGIFYTQSCSNRCLETESVRENSTNNGFFKNRHLIEKCDCHQECVDKSTCCLDYVSICIESTSQPTDLDIAISTTDESAIGMTSTELNEMTTPVNTTTLKSTILINSTFTSTSSTISTTLRTTIKSIIKSITTSANNLVSTSISMNPTLITQFATPTYRSEIENDKTVAMNMPSKKIELTTKPIETKTKMSPATKEFAKKNFSSPKSSSTTSNAISTTTSASSKMILISIQTTRRSITQKLSPSTTWQTPKYRPEFVTISSTDTTSDTMLMHSNIFDKQKSHRQFAWISSIILICILSVVILTGWKYFATEKWNRFNSHQIEFKSNYHSDENEEILLRSKSFIIDDSFNKTLIDKTIDEGSQSNQSKNNSKSKKASTDKTKTCATIPNITKKVSDRLTKMCDQYSEKRCLTIDDEQFDFSLQTYE